MSKKKKPEGQAWEDFVDRWYLLDHMGKIALAKEHGVTYDTAKHWVSESGATQKPEPESARFTVEDILGLRPAVNLDFVCFDIETSNLTADFSIMLSAVIKPFGQPPIVFRADKYPSWEHNRAIDEAIVQDVAGELQKHAIVISHYGDRFDIPYLRAKMVRYGLPPLPPMFGVDSWKIAKQNFKLSSRRLKNLAEYFDIGDKEPVEGALWMDAAYNGSREAMDKVVAHNIKDCEILEKLACLTFGYLKSIPKL